MAALSTIPWKNVPRYPLSVVRSVKKYMGTCPRKSAGIAWGRVDETYRAPAEPEPLCHEKEHDACGTDDERREDLWGVPGEGEPAPCQREDDCYRAPDDDRDATK